MKSVRVRNTFYSDVFSPDDFLLSQDFSRSRTAAVQAWLAAVQAWLAASHVTWLSGTRS